MRNNIFYTFIFISCLLRLNSQDLISNSSFSDVYIRKDSTTIHQLLPGKLSDVKDWYLPTFINYKKHHLVSQFTSLYSFTYYYTSRDKEFFIKNKYYTNSDQLFENNLGFISLDIQYNYPKTVVQQKLIYPINKGRYCFKFKYKFIKFRSSRAGSVKLEFAFTQTNLKEYYKDKFVVPEDLINISFKDTLNDCDKNSPWLQKCYEIELNGNEKYLTIGGLSNPRKLFWGNYYIDDIELYSLSDSSKCNCEIINKDLRSLYIKDFPINKIITNDTLIMLIPKNGFTPGIISPDAKEYLRNVIAYLQRNPDVKIQFIEYKDRIIPEFKPSNYYEFERYLKFYGISKDRIFAENALCNDSSRYCWSKTELMQIGIKFFK